MVVVSEAINPIYVEYNNVTEAVTVSQISFRTRDFDWQGDTTTYDESKSSPSIQRQYDTENAGWVAPNGDTALSAYQSANSSKHPPLTHAWYAGKNSSGAFDAAEWAKVYTGNSLTGNGHYILDFFSKNRSTASGISGLTTEVESSRFKSVANFAGRAFYAGLNLSLIHI